MTPRIDSRPVKMSLLFAFVAINLAIGGLVSWLKLPIYLDSIGIVLATVLLGWVYGLGCAALTVLLGFLLINPYLPFYAGTSVSIVATVEILRRRDYYRSFGTTLISGLILAAVSAVVSAPVTAKLFGGVTASGADVITAVLKKTGQSLLNAVILSGLSSETVDKTVVTLLAISIIRGLPDSFLSQFDLRSYRQKRAKPCEDQSTRR